VARLNRAAILSADELKPKMRKAILRSTPQDTILSERTIRLYAFNIAQQERWGRPVFTAPVRSYLAGELEIFHMYGNVAEMLSNKGQAMGGSFLHQEKEVFAEEGLSYDGPERWLGFRCVCEINHL
jgi:hypothetical protein